MYCLLWKTMNNHFTALPQVHSIGPKDKKNYLPLKHQLYLFTCHNKIYHADIYFQVQTIGHVINVTYT